MVNGDANRDAPKQDANRAALSCEEVWREISNYLEEEVDPALRSAMDEHLRGCKRCTSVLEGMRNVIRLYEDERMIEVPAGFGQRLEKRLVRSARRSSRRLTWETWLIPVAALALIAGGLRVANSLTTGRPVKSEQAQVGQGIPPDLVVVVKAGSKVFHVPGCRFIHGNDNLRKMTAKEAIREGYVPCSRCLRKYLEADVGHGVSGAEPSMDADGDDDVKQGSGQ
jgi:methylphosphotriester-DNA--protein-cysteine methyltransferase